jgi:GNAT superfamily N-acetyltransferase
MEKSIEFRPLTPPDWPDLEQLFGVHGAAAGCWCMWWRQTQNEFQRLHGESNRLALKSLVESGTIPGILSYRDGEPTGWCAIEPREAYHRLERSKTLARIDTKPVWSLTCFYVSKQHRGEGLMRSLLNSAIDWAAKNHARIIEAYPISSDEKIRSSSAYTGVLPIFTDCGFVEVVRRTPRQPIVRKYL